MAEDHGPQGISQQSRRETKARFGRNAILPRKPRRSILQWIGVVVLLAAFVGVMVTYGPSHRTSRGLFHDWFAERREAQRQRKIAVELQHVEQIKRDMEALQLKSKARSEEAWKEFDKRMQPLQPAPQQKPTEERQASVDTNDQPVAPQQVQLPTPHTSAVVWLSVSPDGTQLLSASTDKSIKLWDLRTGLLVRDVGHHADMVRAALFFLGGSKVLSGADDGMIDIWSVGDGRLEKAMDGRKYGGVRGLAISGDESLAASSHESGTVVIWDLKAGRRAECADRSPVACQRSGNFKRWQARCFRRY